MRFRMEHGKFEPEPPVLFVDVDGVISTYGFDLSAAAPGRFQLVDGIVHHIAPGMGERLVLLAERFELVWATGWGDRANDHLPAILGLPRQLPVVEFDSAPGADGGGHWKLSALDRWSPARPSAWIDDGHNDACVAWARARAAPTLLVPTDPAVGMTDRDVETLLTWAISIAD